MSRTIGIIYEWTTCHGGINHDPEITGLISHWESCAMAGDKTPFRFVRAEAADGTEIYIVFKPIEKIDENPVVEILTYSSLLNEEQQQLTETYLCSKWNIVKTKKEVDFCSMGFIT
jgi:hypothetical protein